MTRSGFAICSAFAMLLLASAAQSDEIVVTRYDDPPPDGCQPDDCSLREAVIAANSTADLDEILLSSGTYELSIPNGAGDEDQAATGDLDLDEPVRISGPGARLTTIDANGLDRIIEALPEAGIALLTHIRGITFRGGNAQTASAMLLGDQFILSGCEVRDNGEPGVDVPAVRAGLVGDVFIIDTTIAGNHGSGLELVGSEVAVGNVTLSGNAFSELLVADEAVVLCTHCTIVVGADQGVAQVLVLDDGLLGLLNSVVVGECATLSGGAILSLGGNLESPGATCALDHADDEDGVARSELLLGPLEDNGGTTRTHLPEALSHAVDTAREEECSDFDQRGVGRTLAECDRGAVERSTERPFTPLFIDGFEQGSAGAWSTAP